MTSSFNPLDHPIAFKRPTRVTASSWTEHIPFAMTLVDLLRPRTVVEVGPGEGALHSALREAVRELAVEARCDAVRTSDEALAACPDGSIDLLHIEECPSQDALKRDFEAWLPKMSTRGVVLLHDIQAPGSGSGTSVLWTELKTRHPFLEFTHAGGLGVLAVGHEQPAAFRALLDASPDEAARTRTLFARLGRALRFQAEQEDRGPRPSGREAERLRQRLVAREEEIKAVRQYLQAREDELRSAHEELDRIRRSLAWRALSRYRRLLQSSRLLRFAHLLVAWPVGWIGAAFQRRARARTAPGALPPQLLFLPRPEAEQARRELESLRGRFPGHAVSVVVPRGQRALFAGDSGPSSVRIYDRPHGSVWGAGLELVRELRERTFDVVALPWQPAFEGARFSMSLILALLVKARARVVLGPELEPRPLRRRMVVATLFELFVFLAGLPFARLATLLPLLLARRAGDAPAPEPGKPNGALAILIPILPDLSHTFIYREVLRMLAHTRGQRRVVVVALEEGSYRPLHPEARALLAHAVFVRSPSLAGYLRTYLRYLVTRPLRLARLIRLLSTDGRPDASLFLRVENLHGLHPSRGLALARLLEREGVDYVHCYGMSYPATRAIVAARLLGIPFSISTFVDFDYDYPFKCLSEKVREARFVVTCTRYCKERLLTLTDRAHAGKVHVIHHSLDPRYGSPSSNGDAPRGTGRVDLFAASRLVPKKGFDYLLQATARLRDRGLDVRCRLMGDGEEGPRLKQLAAEMELTDRVWFAGSVPNDQVWTMAGPHDVCVLPSVYCGDGERDGIPVILLEALSRGHAVVSTRVSGIPELIEDGVHGLLVPDRDADALADAIERVVTDHELRERLAQAGRDRVRTEFNLEDKARELLGLIEAARGEPRTGPAAAGDLADARRPGSRPSVSVVLVNYNGARYVERLFDSLARQTYPAAEVLVFDNGSTDGSDRVIEERYPWVRVFRLGRNTGYSFPVNEGIRRSSGEHVLVLNVDLVLADEFVEEMVAVLEEDPGVGWVAGKVLKLRDSGPSEDIDCLGHHMSRNRYARERDYSRPFAWADYAEKRFVFGASACAALYRRAMLDDIRLGIDYFDEDFFAYFEDVDVDWRAQQRGWKCVYTPRAVAYHVRGGTGLIRQRHIAACYLANRWLMMVKNDDPAHLLQDLRPVMGQLVRDVGRTALKDPLVIPVALGRLARNLPRMVRKRKAIKARRTVPRAYLRDLIR